MHFDVPSDAPETTSVNGSAGILWVLTAESSLSGIDLLEEFDVPVYHTGAASTDSRPVAHDPVTIVGEPITQADIAASGIDIRSTADGTEYYFAPARNRSIAAGMTAFTALWTGALLLQRALDFPWIFPAITGPMELLLIALVIDLWLGSTKVTIGSGVVRKRHSILGLGVSRAIPFENITRLDLHISMQTTGRTGTPYCELRATLANGRRQSLGSGVRDKRQAEWPAAQMRSAIGLLR